MIRWPAEMHPSRTAIHVSNELEMQAPAEAVWAWLIRAELWPTWYVNARKVRIVEGAPRDLAEGTRFKWRTFSVAIDSTVKEWKPYERIAWSARGVGIQAYHAWLIERTSTGCHVRTDETQNGVMARANSAIFPKRMRRYHQIWLEVLNEKAKSGPPPP